MNEMGQQFRLLLEKVFNKIAVNLFVGTREFPFSIVLGIGEQSDEILLEVT